tara:strand:- start:223 stop:789 length:567 start_codon:yes stop_codon:yes gene_type:complete
MDIIKDQLNEANQLLTKIINDKLIINSISEASEIMINSIKNGKKIISCGNGGSMCDAMHFAEELTGKFRDERKSLPALSISDPSHITCVGNDFGFDKIFSKYLEGVGKSGDTLLAISTSGNSKNVVNAAKYCTENNINVISLTGNNGGKLSKYSNVEIRVPHFGYSDRIQEIHIKIIHILILLIENNQ